MEIKKWIVCALFWGVSAVGIANAQTSSSLQVSHKPLQLGASYDLAYTYSPRPAGGFFLGVQIRLHRHNPLIVSGDSETIVAGSIDEMLTKPELSEAERAELRTYSGMDQKALQALRKAVGDAIELDSATLERKAARAIASLSKPQASEPEPFLPSIHRDESAGNDNQVLDFTQQARR